MFADRGKIELRTCNVATADTVAMIRLTITLAGNIPLVFDWQPQDINHVYTFITDEEINNVIDIQLSSPSSDGACFGV